jgi:TfoX/Sxy family transcriptional regulator of competence genes
MTMTKRRMFMSISITKKPVKVKIGTLIEEELLRRVKEECAKNHIQLNTAIEFGLEKFLEYLKEKSNE